MAFTDLANGSAVSFTITAGGTVRTTSSGGSMTADVSSVQGESQRFYGPQTFRKTFGPYNSDATVTLTCTGGTISYDATAPLMATPAQAAAFPGLVSGDGIVRVIGQSAVPIAHTGTTVATSLAIIPVPANVMGPNGALRVSVWWSMTNNANSKNLNIRWGNGNTTIWSAGLASWAAAAGQVMVCNRGNAGSQLASATGTTAVFGQLPGFVTASEDTTIDQRIQITATLANAADTLTIERYLVEVLR